MGSSSISDLWTGTKDSATLASTAPELTSPVPGTAPLCTRGRPTPRGSIPSTNLATTHPSGSDSPFPPPRLLPRASLLLEAPSQPYLSQPGHVPSPPHYSHLLAGLPHPPSTSSSFLAFPVTNTIFFPAKDAAMAIPVYCAGVPEVSLYLSCRHFRMAAEGAGWLPPCDPGKVNLRFLFEAATT